MSNKEQQPKHTPWIQGRLLDTHATRKYSKEERSKAEAYEKERVFINFTEKDQGISRDLVAVFTNEEFALRAIECVNANEGLQKYKTACEAINPANPMVVAENLIEIKEYLEYMKNFSPYDSYVVSKAIELLTKIQAKP